MEIQRKTQEFTVLQIHTFKQPFTGGEKGQSNGYLDTSVVCDPDSPHQGSVKWLQSLGGSVGWGTAMLGEMTTGSQTEPPWCTCVIPQGQSASQMECELIQI